MRAAQQLESLASVDSVYTELLGLRDALQTLAQGLGGTQVLHRTDSISTYAVVANAGSTRSERPVRPGQAALAHLPAAQHHALF